MNELDNNEKNTIPENLVQEPTDGKNDQSGKEERGMDNERKKSSGLLWLLLVLLVAILTGIIFMITPQLSNIFPDVSNVSTSTMQASSNVSLDQSKLMKAYFDLTVAMPVMIGLLTLMTFINLIIFIFMSFNIGTIRRSLEDLYDIIANK